MLLLSCKKQGCTDPVATNYNQYAEQDDGSCNYPTYENQLHNIIDNDFVLTNDKIWYLNGRTTVTNGAILTIEPGTIIKGVGGSGANASCLIISRGSKIHAVGTPTQPIIFTSEADDIQLGELQGNTLTEATNGLWGGVLICGQAPISADNESMQIEGIPASDQDGLYGGNIETDDSGILEYISIRHGGANIGAGNEINGLTLGGVGSNTIVNNIEIVANQDDGIELFGGNVNVSNILVWSIGDDCVDIDQGYNGSITNVTIIPSHITDHIMEIDGGEGIWNLPFSMTNCHIIAETSEAHFRDGAEGNITYFGSVNFEADTNTNVIVNELFDQPSLDFGWTYYYNR